MSIVLRGKGNLMLGRRRIRRIYECSFCGKNKEQVEHLIAGPGGVYICDECVGLFSGQNTGERAGYSAEANATKSRCSFCGKKQKQVQYLIMGPNQVNICSQCIDLCREIIDEEKSIKKQ